MRGVESRTEVPMSVSVPVPVLELADGKRIHIQDTEGRYSDN